MKLRLLFSTTNWPFSYLIRAVTWSKWSHVSIVDGDYVIQAAMKGGVQRTPLQKVLAKASKYEFVDFEVDDAQAIINAAASQIGKPYDWLGVIGLWFHRDWQDDSSWWCSELPAWAFEQAGHPLFRGDMVRRITPQNLWMLSPQLLASKASK